jgi:ribonuclease PH
VVDLEALGERQVTLDCDVIQADGGTRTAAITGGWVALALAARRLLKAGKVTGDPMRLAVAAISAGIIDGEARVDLPYVEDSQAEVDCNFVMTGDGRFVEVQATAEKDAFSADQYAALVTLAAKGTQTLFARQREALERARP